MHTFEFELVTSSQTDKFENYLNNLFVHVPISPKENRFYATVHC